jgi:hypothetical protein
MAEPWRQTESLPRWKTRQTGGKTLLNDCVGDGDNRCNQLKIKMIIAKKLHTLFRKIILDGFAQSV